MTIIGIIAPHVVGVREKVSMAQIFKSLITECQPFNSFQIDPPMPSATFFLNQSFANKLAT